MSDDTRRLAAADVGGTFTDFVVQDENGQLEFRKTRTNSEHPSRPVRRITEESGVDGLNHGTTIAINTLLERTGGDTVLITNKGFEDLLFIGRQDRPSLYDFRETRPDPVIDSEQVLGVDCRVTENGEIINPLREAELKRLQKDVRSMDPDAVAICLLHSYANSEHEERIAEQFSDDYPVRRSSKVLPEFREYRRTSTTVIDAYLTPPITRYIQLLDEGISSSLNIMRSYGGLGTSDEVIQRPGDVLLSGPAGGVVAASKLADNHNDIDSSNLVTFDMGGTSADIALVLDGEPVRTSEARPGGLPVGIPMIDIETIGAGGGSIAYLDSGGALQVGPRSAGADPGPVCYGRGGARPTVTDAHLIRGHLGPETKLAGDLLPDTEATISVFETFVQQTELTVSELAKGILRIANSRMKHALRKSFNRQGLDPANFSLVAYGGAGPLHACALADSIGIDEVLVPREPGVFSAQGIFQADYVAERSRTILEPFQEAQEVMDRYSQKMERAIRSELQSVASDGTVALFPSVDLRYRGQSYEINVPVRDQPVEQFHRLHKQRYGFQVDHETVELVNFRMRGVISGDALEFEAIPTRASSPRNHRSPLASSTNQSIPIFHRRNLGRDQEISGPAIVEEMSGTMRIEQGWTGTVLSDGTMRMKRRSESSSSDDEF